MSFVDSERAGKRLVIYKDGNGGVTRIRPLPPQENEQDYKSAVTGGEVVFAGAAVKKGYLTYNELKEMFPKFSPEQLEGAGIAAPVSTTAVRKRKVKITEQTYVSRWGLVAERTSTLPRWQPLADHGKTREHIKNYLKVEERRTTFKVTIDEEGKEQLLSCCGQVCVPYEPRHQEVHPDQDDAE